MEKMDVREGWIRLRGELEIWGRGIIDKDISRTACVNKLRANDRHHSLTTIKIEKSYSTLTFRWASIASTINGYRNLHFTPAPA